MQKEPKLPQVQINTYKGSLFRLVELVRYAEIPAKDIPVIDVIHQYLRSPLQSEPSTTLLFCYYVAELLYLKSSMLIGSKVEELSEEESQHRSTIIEMLIEYQRYRKLAQGLLARYQYLDRVLARQALFPREEKTKLRDSLVLQKTFLDLKKKRKEYDIIIPRVAHIDIKEAREIVEGMLPRETVGSVFFSSLCDAQHASADLAVIYNTLLQMTRDQVLSLDQKEPWGDILIERGVTHNGE